MSLDLGDSIAELLTFTLPFWSEDLEARTAKNLRLHVLLDLSQRCDRNIKINPGVAIKESLRKLTELTNFLHEGIIQPSASTSTMRAKS